jgi:hypothetical protein
MAKCTAASACSCVSLKGGFFVAVAPLVLPQRADHVDDDLDVGPEFELPLLGLRAHVRRMVPRVVS